MKHVLSDIMQGTICPYCNKATVYASSKEVYGGRDYGMIYLCRPCNAYVGVHKSEPTVALGRLANAELRECKKKAHAAFDPIWKNGHMDRTAAYAWLSEKLSIERDLCHIGMFDVAECKKLVEVCETYFNPTKSY